MVTDATNKLREPVAYALLIFAGLIALASLIRLFVGGAGFTAAAGGVQGTLTPPGLTALVLLFSLAGSVWLVSEGGERTPNARTVALASLVLTGVVALLGLITAFAGFAETSTAGLKIVGFIYAIGGLALYGAAGLYILKTYQALPAPVRAPKPGQFAPQGQYGGQYGQQAPYGQQQGGYGQQQPQTGYGQYDQGQGQYGGAYGAAAAGAAGGYAAAQGEQWPQEQAWNQGEQHNWSAGEAEAQQQPAEQAWSGEPQTAEPTQAWSAEAQQQWSGQDQGQQWPQEQQWSGADAGQQQWAGQEYAQQEWPVQPESVLPDSVLPESGQQEQAQPEAPQAWPQSEQAQPEAPQSWQSEQAWPASADDGPSPEPLPEPPQEQQPPATEAADETRVDPRVSEPEKDDQQGQGQQGWWSQPS